MPAPFSVRYFHGASLASLPPIDSGRILGVIGYGAARSVDLPDGCPFALAALPPVDGNAGLEVWSAPSPIRYRRSGSIAAAETDAIIFGIAKTNGMADRPLEAIIEKTYLDILDFLDETGYPFPIRFWNYLPWITADQNGLERYRRFNIGRHDAFSAKLRLPVPPAASAVGARSGAPLLYFMAAREPARAIENPRQVSAYRYPPAYGPRSPRFSRASVFGTGAASALLVSGTASIVGHESLHPGDYVAQIAETLENITAIIQEAAKAGFHPADGRWAFKIYLRDPASRDFAEARLVEIFGKECDRIYLSADVCRSELLVEIEAVCLDGAT